MDFGAWYGLERHGMVRRGFQGQLKGGFIMIDKEIIAKMVFESMGANIKSPPGKMMRTVYGDRARFTSWSHRCVQTRQIIQDGDNLKQ